MKYSNYAVYDTTFNFLSSDGNGFWACLDFVELHIFSVLFNFYEYLILNLIFCRKNLTLYFTKYDGSTKKNE